MYFTTLFNLAKKIPAEPSPVGQAAVEEEGRQTIKVRPQSYDCLSLDTLSQIPCQRTCCRG